MACEQVNFSHLTDNGWCSPHQRFASLVCCTVQSKVFYGVVPQNHLLLVSSTQALPQWCHSNHLQVAKTERGLMTKPIKFIKYLANLSRCWCPGTFWSSAACTKDSTVSNVKPTLTATVKYTCNVVCIMLEFVNIYFKIQREARLIFIKLDILKWTHWYYIFIFSFNIKCSLKGWTGGQSAGSQTGCVRSQGPCAQGQGECAGSHDGCGDLDVCEAGGKTGCRVGQVTNARWTRGWRGWGLTDPQVQHCGVVCNVREEPLVPPCHPPCQALQLTEPSPLNQGAYHAVPDQSAGTDTEPLWAPLKNTKVKYIIHKS